MYRSASLLALCLAAAGTLAACDTADDDLAAVTAAERLPGGSGTNTLLLGSNAFTPPLDGLDTDETLAFYSGNSFFSQAWVQAPASTDARDGLGPMFNARSCSACHAFDGRGRPPLEDDEEIIGLLFRLSVPGAAEDEAPYPDPVYGGQLQPFGLGGVPAEATPRILREEIHGAYDDGTPYTLERPTYVFEDPAYGDLPDDLEVSPRVAPQVIGMGLLEAIPEADILALADPDDADGDGISGRAQYVTDPRTGELALGRFGWKGDAPTVEAQSAGAFHGDMGLTTSLHPEPECTDSQTVCSEVASGGDPEVSDLILGRVTSYLQFLAVPVRTRWDDTEIRRGKHAFNQIGCASCHVAEHTTREDAISPALSSQRIFPYTDLLLHDMGPDLADDRPLFRASGQEWKTPPLWGIGRFPTVNDHDRLLHDGRARGVAEAILWHGGEAEASRDAFKALDAARRAALIAFVESL